MSEKIIKIMTIIKPITPTIAAATAPDVAKILAHQTALQPWILTTPVWQLQTRDGQALIGERGALFFKMECWQHTGTFKARGAITNVMRMDKAQLQLGITAVSAGNHAIAASYAAHSFNTSAKVLMPKTASPARIKKCREYNADIIFTENMHELFDRVAVIQEEEGRALVHPFEGESVALGTATLGAELCQQLPDLDAVLIAVGGGGLISGAAAAIKQLQPNCKVYGAEPFGANSMTQSFETGAPVELKHVSSVADSLCAPHAAPYSYSLCTQFVDGLVNVSDDAICDAMRFAFNHLKMALEPATATALAALMGPLHETLHNKRVAILICGTNTDPKTFNSLVSTPSNTPNETCHH
jgi:threonine dehydratase